MPISEVKPPGSATAGGKSQDPKGPVGRVTASKTTLHKPLEEFMGMVSIPFLIGGDYYCAYIINTRGLEFAHALADLAEKNPGLKRTLRRLIEGGQYGQVIYTGLAMLAPIGFHHGLDKLGLINPFELNEDEGEEYLKFCADHMGAEKFAQMFTQNVTTETGNGAEENGHPGT
jgi:hypothetical protein